jgi:hypothetical protein
MFKTIACSSTVDPWASVSYLDWTSGSLCITEYLGFQKGSPGTSVCAWRHIGRFLEYDRGRNVATKKFYPEPHHLSVSLMDVQKDFGENKRDKDNQHEVELALLGFEC